MKTPIGTLPDWVAWLIGTSVALLTIVVSYLIYRWQQKKPRPSNLRRPRFQRAHEVALDNSGNPDVFELLKWQTRFAEGSLPGRQQGLQKLLGWAEEGQDVKVGILAAPGGAGKTRLAMEAAEILAKKGWEAGFHDAADGDDLHLPSKKQVKGWFRQQGLFLIIDYPEARDSKQLRNILRKVRDWQEKVQVPARILLLVRLEQAKDLQGKLQQDLHGISLMEVAPLRALDERDALQLAHDVHNALKECAPFQFLAQGWEERFIAWLKQDKAQHGLPLFVIAAMLEAMLSENSQFTLGAREILEELAEREKKRAEQASKALRLPEEALPRLLGLAVLAGGLDGRAIARLRGQDGLGENALNEDALRQTPWWNRQHNRLMLEAPDRPAAAFVSIALLDGAHEHDLPEWLWLALQDVADDFAERLPRLLWDIGEFDGTAKKRLLSELQNMVAIDVERAKAFRRIAEQQSHLTAPLAVTIGNTLVTHGQGDKAAKAALLNNLSVDLSLAGRHKEALEKAQEAANIYRQLAEDNPQAFMPNLAMSLNNLATFLSELGRREEALEKAQEAADIYRQLAEDNPQAFMPYLAGSLNNLANILSELGRREEALEPAQEAVEIRRRLAEDNPQAFMPYLAGSLNNLAAFLSELGRREEALEPAQEAANIRRRLAEDNPPAFMPDLARSLGVLGLVLLGLERADEARKTLAEGLRVITPFAQALPAAHGPLALTLAQIYMQTCQAVGREPDAKLLQPLVPVLAALQEQRQDDG